MHTPQTQVRQRLQAVTHADTHAKSSSYAAPSMCCTVQDSRYIAATYIKLCLCGVAVETEMQTHVSDDRLQRTEPKGRHQGPKAIFKSALGPALKVMVRYHDRPHATCCVGVPP